MRAAKLLEQRWKDVQTHRHAAGDSQQAVQFPVLVAHLADGRGQVVEQALPEQNERLSGPGRHGAAPLPDEQRLAQLVLEQQDLAADRRLRDVQLFTRAGERPGLGDGAKNLELPKIHRWILLRYLQGPRSGAP